jgi:type VI secretion system protein VasD
MDEGMPGKFRFYCALILLGGVLLAMSGCKHAPPAPPPRVPLFGHVTITANGDANPDPTGRASPVVIRIYRLRNGDAFNGAGMETLYFKDREVLAPDLIARDEWELRPGETRDIRWELPADAQVLGIMAALRDFGSVPWRLVVAVPPSPAKGPHVLAVTAQISAAGLQLQSSGLKDK